MRERRVEALMVSGDALATDEFWAIAGAAGEGTVMTFTPDPRKLPSARAVVDSFTAAGVDPEGYTLPAYAAIQAWAEAARALGTFDSRKIAEWLRAGNTLHTVLGELSLDRKGDLKNALHVLHVWSNGKHAETTSP
jgi:branched-chain amino acid transport system substrate-binding protein